MNQYAYRVYRNVLTNPVYGGTVTAGDMESASHKIIQRCDIDVIHASHNGQEYHYFMLKGEKVGIIIYLNPEEF